MARDISENAQKIQNKQKKYFTACTQQKKLKKSKNISNTEINTEFCPLH
jgi:hypothetical protein